MQEIDIASDFRQVTRMAVPVSLQAFAGASFGLLDVAMAQGLGPDALAAVGLAGRLLFFGTMLQMGLAGGAAALLSQYAGIGDVRAGGRVMRWVALVGLAVALPPAVLLLVAPDAVARMLTDEPTLATPLAAFLRGVGPSLPMGALVAALATTARCYGDTRAPLLAGLAALTLNAVLNALLIYGLAGLPAWGVFGAGVATSVARAAELAALVALVARRRGWAAQLWDGLVSSRWAVPRLAGVALPFMAQEAAWAGGLLALTFVFAAMGSAALAISALLAPIEGLLITAFVGGAVACGIVVGQRLGQGRFAAAEALARHCLRRFALAAAPVCAIGGGVSAVAVAQLDWLGDARGTALAATLLAAVLVWLRVVTMTLVLGVLRAGGDQRGVIAVDLLLWSLLLPLAAAGALRWGWDVAGVYALLAASEAVKAVLLRRRMARGPWRRRLVVAPLQRPVAACAG